MKLAVAIQGGAHSKLTHLHNVTQSTETQSIDTQLIQFLIYDLALLYMYTKIDNWALAD